MPTITRQAFAGEVCLFPVKVAMFLLVIEEQAIVWTYG